MKRFIAVLCLCGVLTASFCGCKPEEAVPMTDSSEQTTVQPVQIESDEYVLTYSGEMKDLISTAEREEGLEFSVRLSYGTEPIFTIRINVLEGELVQMIDGPNGEKIPVSFAMNLIPENLSQEDQLTFCSAQDLVNDIIGSLKLK